MKFNISKQTSEHRLESTFLRLLVAQTIRQIVEIEAIHTANYPLKAKLVDGLNGSWSHTIYNQMRNHPDITTKRFLLFVFKIIWLQYFFGNTIWKNPSPNSPFAIRPLALLAQGENRDNLEYLMDSIINQETKFMEVNRVMLAAGKVNVDITRCLFDTKMAAISLMVQAELIVIYAPQRKNNLMTLNSFSRGFLSTVQLTRLIRPLMTWTKRNFFLYQANRGLE